MHFSYPSFILLNWCAAGIAIRAAPNCQTDKCIYQGNQVRLEAAGKAPASRCACQTSSKWPCLADPARPQAAARPPISSLVNTPCPCLPDARPTY